MLKIVGLGLNDGDISLTGDSAIKTAEKVFVKTAKTATYKYFTKNNLTVTSFDDIYDQAEDFSDLDRQICQILIKESQNANVVFCVNGGGADDSTVATIVEQTKAEIISCGGFSGGLSFSPDTSYSLYGAYDVLNSTAFFPDKRHTVIIKEIDSKLLAGELKLVLQRVYGDDKTVKLVSDNKGKSICLSDLDKQSHYGYDTACVISAEDFLSAKRFDFSDLISIMEGLLGENGCPWDRAQTHESIRINLIEEAYELIDAIDKFDIENMQEETGDVLLQAVFHAMLGKKGAEYDIYDTLTALCHKLVSRHTHIFGENKATNPEEALKFWNAAKNVEKNYESLADKMEKVPKNLPALLYAYKIQKIAVKCGFDWDNIDGAYDKLFEEISELQSATGDEVLKEAGDVLFSAINPMRFLKVEPELALKSACEKFINRFKFMESQILENGLDISDEAIREKYWAESKKIYK